MAMASPFFMGSQQLVIIRWFPSNERALAQALLSLSLVLGGSIAYAISGMQFSDTINNTLITTQQESIVGIRRILELQTFINGFGCLFLLVFFRNLPRFPPSLAATVPIPPLNMRDFARELKINNSYSLLVITFTILFGLQISIGNVWGSLMQPFGYSSRQCSVTILASVAGGLIGLISSGIILDKTNAYKKALLFQILLCILTFVIFALLLLFEGNYILIAFVTALAGGCITSAVPTGLSFAIELTFPMQPALINGAMIWLGQGAGFL